MPVGRPAHKPTDGTSKQVEAMCGYGVPEADIARVLGIDPKTLRKYYRDELDTGHIKANSRVAESLFRKATGDGTAAVTAAIWWSKARMGWKETMVNEMTGKDGGPIEHRITDDAERFTSAIIGLAARAGEKQGA